MVALVDLPDPSMFLMVAVSVMVDDTNFKVALERDPSMDLRKFYHEAEKFLRLEDAKAGREEINVMRDGGPFQEGLGKDKGKRKVDVGFNESKQQRREPILCLCRFKRDFGERFIWILEDVIHTKADKKRVHQA